MSARFGAGAVVIASVALLLPSSSFAQAPQRSSGPVAPLDPVASVRDDREALRGLWISGGRYRITPGDVIECTFPYVAEFNQTVTVQPDGFISLRAITDLRAAGRTVPELRQELIEAYEQILREPVVTLVLREFEKPYFVIGGEVTRPGRYDMRGAMTVTQAISVAGGKTSAGNISEVVLFRRHGDDLVDVKRIDVKRMYSKRDLSEDPVLRPGDTLFVPQSTFSKIEPFIPKPTVGFFLNPFDW